MAWVIYDEAFRGEPLCSSAMNQNWGEVRLLLSTGSNPSQTNDMENYRTALFWAAYYNQDTLVKLMILKGVDVNAVDTHGNTALDWAHDDNIRAMLKKVGARPGDGRIGGGLK